MNGVFAVGLVGLAAACSAPPPALAPESAAALAAGRARLSELRARAAEKAPRTMRLTLALREPFAGRVLRARGAVAVAPPDALRMILLGPGGTTALDLWTRGGSFRFAVPPIGLVKRGDASTPRETMRGMPVDFMRWWLLAPASGRLLWHERLASGDRFVLRDGRAIVDLTASDDGRVHATRATFGEGAPGVARRIEEELVDASGVGCADVHYRQQSTRLEVEVHCEGEELGHAPSPRAFVDPDEAKP